MLAETDDADDRVLNALWARAKANQEYRVARGYYRGSSSCQSTPIRKRQAGSSATTSDSGRRAARRSSSDAAASSGGFGVYDLAVYYNGSLLETAPDGSDRFVSVSVQLDPDPSVPLLFDMRRDIARLIDERCVADVRSRAHGYLDIFCDEQLRAAYGVLIDKKKVVVVSGPAGSGKSELLKLLVAIDGGDNAVLAPTQGSRRVCQVNIDAALPRRSFKPELEALTTFVGFGCAWGEAWDVVKIVTGLGRNELRRWKAAKLYDTARRVVVDEGAQTPVEHLDAADAVAQRRRQCSEVFGGLQMVLFMDAVQTPPPTVRNARGAEMLWEAQFFQRAEAAGDVGVYALERVWRTDEPKLLALAAACRREDADAAWPLVEEAKLVHDDGSFTDLVHDNVELYPLAKDKYDTPGAR